MLADGQIWSLPDGLGYDLQQSLRVSRCSSQDPGADTTSDIIVATASLEVGYDDPDVGAMVHHKAPRSIASFLQRKGRAGRTRGSRPTTLVVMSDWGRDRWLFQNSDRLFQPEIEPIKVPLLNPYVQHVQATSFLLDWLGRRIGSPDPIRFLRRPEPYMASQQRRAASLLRRLLELGDDYSSFRRELGWVIRHTQRFRAASEEDIDRLVDAMLWEAPRPVLRHAVPALLRKLETGWRLADPQREDAREESGARQPLPSFIPSASFAELAASDVVVEFPGTEKDSETRGIASQLMESCPGRVSKRFSIGRRERGYWLVGSNQLLDTPSPVVMSPGVLFPESIGTGDNPANAALQPIRMSFAERPMTVKDSSNARWLWETGATPVGDGRSVPLFAAAQWQSIFAESRAYLHGDLNAVQVWRRTSEGEFDILLRGGVERRGTVLLGSTGEDSAIQRQPIGFQQTVDALVFTVHPSHLASTPDLNAVSLGRLRQDYFKHLLLTSPALRECASSFTLEWAWQTSLAMLTAKALEANCSLEAAQEALEGERVVMIGRVLTRMHSVNAFADDEPDDHDAGGRARLRLEGLWADPVSAAEIRRAETALWRDLDPSFQAWLRQRHLRSLAEACLSGVLTIAGDVGEGDLIADVLDGNGRSEIVISETAPGGIGQIEAFLQAALDGAGAFERAFAHALHFCRRAHTAENLLSIVANVRSGGALASAFSEVRQARGYQQALLAQATFTESLEVTGHGASRQDVVSVTGRLLRPGTETATDAWFDGLNRVWREREARLGAPIDPRVFAYLLVDSPIVRRRFSALITRLTGQIPSEAQMFSRAQDFLVEGCHDSCPQCLRNSNRFTGNIQPSRSLTRQWLEQQHATLPEIEVSPGWLERLRSLLAQADRVVVIGRSNDQAEIARTLQTLLTEPFERDYLMVWPILSGVHRAHDTWRAEIELRSMGVQ